MEYRELEYRQEYLPLVWVHVGQMLDENLHLKQQQCQRAVHKVEWFGTEPHLFPR